MGQISIMEVKLFNFSPFFWLIHSVFIGRQNFYLGKSLETEDVWLGASWIDNVTEWKWMDDNVTEFNWTNFGDSCSFIDDGKQIRGIATNLIPNNTWTVTDTHARLPETVICQLIQYPVGNISKGLMQ